MSTAHTRIECWICWRRSLASVPPIWPLEVANAVAIGERRQRLAPADVMRFLELLRELPIEIDAQTAARALSHTLPLARTHRLSAYDAAYLELAMREKLILTTLDNRLRKRHRVWA